MCAGNDDARLTDAERYALSIYGPDVRVLAGEVATTLRTSLFNKTPAAWSDMWLNSQTCVRLEWDRGPEVADVVALLAAREGEGCVHGVPGLRAGQQSAEHALMKWYGGAVPIDLSLTRTEL